jgi:hypothetical protein
MHRLKTIWGSFIYLMGSPDQGKVLSSTPEHLLTLLNPIVARPNSEELLATEPLLELLTA